jgi:uncharacterized protein YndB with AHSA1/START domain
MTHQKQQRRLALPQTDILERRPLVDASRTIPASAEKVFDVWMDPKSPGGPWFGAERVILNPVVDGLFYHAVKHEGRIWPHYGRFVQINRPRQIEHTWMSEATKGVESIVAVTFEARGNQTDAVAARLLSWRKRPSFRPRHRSQTCH